jgi:hypothetical protein
MTTFPPFITLDELKAEHYVQQFVYWSVSSVATGLSLPKRCLAMKYSSSTHRHVNFVVTKAFGGPLASNGRFILLNYSGSQPSCHNIDK